MAAVSAGTTLDIRKLTRDARPDQGEPMRGTILQPGGRLDIDTYSGFERDVLAAIEAGAPWLVLDFSDVCYLSSVGVRVVMMATKRLRAAGGRVIVCGLRPLIADVIEISGLNAILEIYSDRESALATLP